MIAHARSLFGDGPVAPETGADRLSAAASSSAAATTRMTGLSGRGVDGHRDFVDRSVPPLAGAARSDAVLGGQLRRAVTVMQDGAARLDALAAENQQTTTLAAGAKTAAAQAVVLEMLRSQADRTQQVVNDACRQASGIANGVQAVDYKTGPPLAPPRGPQPPAPAVTTDELRLKLMEQRIDYNEFVKWFNDTYGGHTSPEEMLTKTATFEGATATLGGSLMALPEGIPLAVGAAILWPAAGFDLATADPAPHTFPNWDPRPTVRPSTLWTARRIAQSRNSSRPTHLCRRQDHCR